MADELIDRPEYRNTMERLEAAKHVSSKGVNFWLAREIQLILGYPAWQSFEAVIERAREAFEGNGIDPSHQIRLTHKLMEVGKGAQLSGADFYLTRGACYLVALNGEPSKPEVAAAQAYFAVQTRKMEMTEQMSADERRLEQREKTTEAFKKVSRRAQIAGVSNKKQPVFHDQRHLGLYDGLSAREVKKKKGLVETDNLLDHAGAYELSIHAFQMNVAADVLEKQGIKGEQKAIEINYTVARNVRKNLIENKATMPEEIALESPIQVVKRRLKAEQRRKLDGPKKP